MTDTLWAQRPVPQPGQDATAMWDWQIRTPVDLTTSRGHLRDQVLRRPVPAGASHDDVDRLLLAFEELASNGLRHGRSPVHATVTATNHGWLIDVSDSAATSTPTPAVDRDPAHGGLGLHLVTQLCAAHGWSVSSGRKHVWACVATAAHV